MSPEEMIKRIEELECELSMFRQYWNLAELVLGEEKAAEIMKAVNLAALTP